MSLKIYALESSCGDGEDKRLLTNKGWDEKVWLVSMKLDEEVVKSMPSQTGAFFHINWMMPGR